MKNTQGHSFAFVFLFLSLLLDGRLVQAVAMEFAKMCSHSDESLLFCFLIEMTCWSRVKDYVLIFGEDDDFFFD